MLAFSNPYPKVKRIPHNLEDLLFTLAPITTVYVHEVKNMMRNQTQTLQDLVRRGGTPSLRKEINKMLISETHSLTHKNISQIAGD